MSVHILLRETGLPFDIEMVDVKAKVRPDGSGYGAVAGRGLVPLLQLAEGATITENAVIAQFICDADAYMFVISSWSLFFGIDLEGLPALRGYLARVGQRQSVRDALVVEGPGLVSLITA